MMNNREFQKKIKRIAYSSILFCCSLMIIGFFLLLVHLNVIPLNKFSTDLDNSYVIDLDFKEPYQAYFDVSLLDDSKDNLEIKFGYELFKNTPNFLLSL